MEKTIGMPMMIPKAPRIKPISLKDYKAASITGPQVLLSHPNEEENINVPWQ